jgi:tripartite-type tricarboxylate transporter receptor subunit TctC
MAGVTRRAVMAGLAGTTGAGAAGAQGGWAPTRSVRILVPYPPGGGADTAARLISGPMTQSLGQSVVVENRPGGAGTVGAAAVAGSAPDGYTLLVDAAAHVINPFILPNPPVDYPRAFVGVSQLTLLAQVLAVRADFPATDLAGFLAAARARPGAVSYATQGNATPGHLTGELLQRRAGITLNHIPYRGGSEAARDLAGGAVDAALIAAVSATPVIQSGRARLIAITTAERIMSFPEVPTVAESGYPGFAVNEWNGLYAPAGTPPAVLARISAAAAAALREAAVVERLAALGARPVGSDPAAFATYLAEQREAIGTIVREARITVG